MKSYCILENVFKMAQYVFGAAFGSFSLLASRSWYFNLEELKVFDIFNVRVSLIQIIFHVNQRFILVYPR